MTKSLFIFALIAGCVFQSVAHEPVIDSLANGKIIFIRSTGFMGSSAAFKTFIDEVFVCRLNNKRYSVIEVTSGVHSASVQFGGTKSKERAEKFEVTVQPGETKYIQIVFENGVLINNVYCEEVTENTALQKMKSLKEDTKCQ
ncbi:hypothetical protein U1E44_15450 [Arenibacter sp. GZD96]|uniref:hypothetical protein n=1 Tax=Aurantibrevibacter litoralis TaxID=3106030 RepID=UPI002AFF7096|nr:hypothetical protein [Arenibacter sp. GZD-96]MEA1787497.1 hypothetical protein [Arenibacter sp. GZD-96]